MVQPSSEFLELQAALAGEYSLQRELGRGGMGIVYLARDVQLDRDVAIKTLPSDVAHRAESRDRFLREARTAAGLSHPHIVPIHRVGEAGGFVFFVMTYVHGETLGERLRTKGPLPPAEAARVLREVAWALAYAHRHGIVHRDIKPDNILLEAGTGRALVTDFGIAHGGAHSGPVTGPGMVMGTAHFISPEQALNERIDGRSDIYALGVVGYLAVSGRLPFDAANLQALVVRQATAARNGVLHAAPGLPPALAAAIDRCLAYDPAERFPDGEALAAALAPAPEARPVLPAGLRAWLRARNPLLAPYVAWSAFFSALAIEGAINDRYWMEIPFGAIMATLPLFPLVGFHLFQARRQFRAGHTLADLRAAIEIARRERAETQEVARKEPESRTQRFLRLGTIASATALAVSWVTLVTTGANMDDSGEFIAVPLLATMLLGVLSNALDVQFIPTTVREACQTGIRDRLWKSRAGEWLARKLGAPERSRAVDAGAFRATEAALGVAAADLFAALPQAFRQGLADLPATVSALEARAAEARAEMDVVAALAPSGSSDAGVLERRRAAASAQLAKSVAALEGIRLDLLRLHAGASDLAPLTTLLDAARLLREDAGRLADAQREVDDAIGRRSPDPDRVLTPV